MNSHTIAKNSLWYGIESGIGLISGVLASIVIARALGPVKLGHYTYIAWLVNVTATVGALGLPSATSKYMAEYIGRNQMPYAKAIYKKTLRLQMYLASIVTVVAASVAWFGAEESMRWTATVLAAAMWPAMVTGIPSQANTAREDFCANLPGALVSNLIYIFGVTLTLLLSRQTLGLALTLLTMRSAELIIRLMQLHRWLAPIPISPLPLEVRRRLFGFSRQSTILLIVSIIVWDRSEVLVLRAVSDIRQLAFYTVVFNMMERLRSIPQGFTAAAGATILAQFGRSPAHLSRLIENSTRYLFLVAAPLHVGIALLAGPMIRLTYGLNYGDTIPLLAVGALLALPKIALMPVNSLLAALDRQDLLVRLNLWMAALNVGMDLFLISSFGAMGAVLANGITQAIAAVALAEVARRTVHVHWPLRSLGKIIAATSVMAGLLLAIPRTGVDSLDLLVCASVGTVAFGAGVRLSGALGEEDRMRLVPLTRKMPRPLWNPCHRAVSLLIPSAATNAR